MGFRNREWDLFLLFAVCGVIAVMMSQEIGAQTTQDPQLTNDPPPSPTYHPPPTLPTGVGKTPGHCTTLKDSKLIFEEVADHKCTECYENAIVQNAQSFSGGEDVWFPRCVEGSLYDSFGPIQCHDSKMECWCSTPTGKEIDGTRKKVTDLKKPDIKCSVEKGPYTCSKLYELAITTNLSPNFVPACLPDGTYSRRQCFPFANWCFCVTPGWKYIHRTMHKKIESDYCDRLYDYKAPCGNPSRLQPPVPHPHMKERYFTCGEGTTFHCICQERLLFDAKEKRCVKK